MTTRASANGTGTTEMEFEEEWEAVSPQHFQPNPFSQGEFEEEWEAAPGSHHYSGPAGYTSGQGEFEDEWEAGTPQHFSQQNPYVQGEFEDEWEAGTPQHFSQQNPYVQGEFEDEWEAGTPQHFSQQNPYVQGEFEDEWEAGTPQHFSQQNPYVQGEFEDEWEAGTPQHFSQPNPYVQGEFEDEWEAGTPQHFSQPNPYVQGEFEDEWEAGTPQHYNHPEMQHPDRFIPLIAKAASKLLPHAIRLGRNLFRRRGSQQQGGPATAGGRSQQISALFHRLGRLFAQGESEAMAHEAEMFGVNEFETEVAGHPAAHMAALTEFLAAEAAHTQSESEAQALIGAALPISIRVMGGRINLQRLTPALVRVNASLVLNLHRQGRPGRQLIRVVPTIQRHTLSTIKAIQGTGRPVTPALATQVMAGHARRVLTNPHICRQALVRNMMIRNRTVARNGARVGPSRRVGA